MKIKIDPLDVLFGKIVRLLADNHCEYCGEYKRLECSHFHGRRKKSTRWDFDNAAALCFTCHREMDEHPDVHTGFFKKRLGSERYEQLGIRARTIVKPDRDKIEAQLKEKLRILEG